MLKAVRASNARRLANKSLTIRQMSSNSTTANGAVHHEQFTKGTLEVSDLSPDPIAQFNTWFQKAKVTAYIPETVVLSTAELPSGRVSARTVYMKGLSPEGGFIVYSNWATSRKSHDINTNPYAALTFHWRELEQQVRVEGRCERISQEEAQVYYDSRIRGSRIGAWASKQSRVLESREELEGQVQDYEKKFEGEESIPVPEFWGGMRVVPDVMEFWQGRDSRLHDRFQYVRDSSKEGGWRIERLSP